MTTNLKYVYFEAISFMFARSPLNVVCYPQPLYYRQKTNPHFFPLKIIVYNNYIGDEDFALDNTFGNILVFPESDAIIHAALRRSCFNVFITDDSIFENIESFSLILELDTFVEQSGIRVQPNVTEISIEGEFVGPSVPVHVFVIIITRSNHTYQAEKRSRYNVMIGHYIHTLLHSFIFLTMCCKLLTFF